MSESWRAVFRDQSGRTYSCPIAKHDGAWAMVTSDGPQPITHEFQDDIAGTLTFVEYRKEEDSRLHVEGGDSFRVLQEAGARATAEYETQREKQRRGKIKSLKQTHASKVAEDPPIKKQR